MNIVQPRAMRRPWLLLALLVVFLLVLGGGFIFVESRSGIRVTVQNAGTTPLHSLVLNVTGKSYSLGDVAPGGSAHAAVNPTSESDLQIGFTDADGVPKRLNAGGYFEPGYRGTIRISIKDGALVENAQNISNYPGL